MTDWTPTGAPDGEALIGGDSPPPAPSPLPDPLPPPPALPRRPLEPDAPVIGGEPPPPEPQRTFYRPVSVPLTPRDRPGVEGAPRSPAFYVVLLLALAIAGTLVFLLFQLLGGGEDDVEPVAPPPDVPAEARIESPGAGDRVTVGQERTVVAGIVSGEALARVELLVGGIVADQRFGPERTGESDWGVALTASFAAAGEYDLVVRAITIGGEEIASEPVRVVAEAPVEVTPARELRGDVVAVASLRTGPGDTYSQAGTLEPGDTVTVTGRTRDLVWLEVERGGGLWVRRAAVTLDGSLDLAPVRETGPAPTAPATLTPEPTGTATPSVTATATPASADPDFIAVNAVLVEGGALLRVTISNPSTNPFAGSIVVGVSDDVPANPSEQVINVSLPPNGTADIDFTLDPPVTDQASVNVTVDPDNAISESNEDNNATNFVLAAPEAGPRLSMAAGITGGLLTVTIRNDGETLVAPTEALLTVSGAGETVSRTISPLVVAEGGSATFDDLAVPQSGATITIRLVILGVEIASVAMPNPNAVSTPIPVATPTATPAPADG